MKELSHEFVGAFDIVMLYDINMYMCFNINSRQMICMVYCNFTVIDVSNRNGVFNWDVVRKAGFEGTFIKATQGADFQDNMFINNWNNAKQSDMPLATYHFYEPGVSYISQVNNFVNSLNSVQFNARSNAFALFVEQAGKISKAQYSDDIYGFITLLSNRWRQSPIFIHTNKTFWDENVDWKRHDFSKVPLWVAEYEVKSPTTLPGNWTSWAGWQYTDKGNINGINGFVGKSFWR